jgi:two-component system, OmpR family, KDP operon response regulator KdpE
VTRILVVDDEPSILAALVPLLRGRGYEVYSATSGQTALDAVDHHAPQLVILDLGLPDMDGAEVCRRIREGRAVPIIVLSARHAESQKVAALDAGADDYVTKPFGPDELLARLRAALRRAEPGAMPAGRIDRGDIQIDVDQRRVTRLGEEVRLTPKEFDLLLYFAQHPGRVLTHRVVLRAIWGPNAVDQPEHLRVLVASLRKKIEVDPSQPRYVQTEPWVGYRFVAEPPTD